MVNQKGFTLVEIMVAVAIIGILAAVAYPNYQTYIIKTKRADMMTELVAMAGRIEATKLAQGSYSKVAVADYTGSFPRSGSPLYNTSLTLEGTGDKVTGWTLTAEPVAGAMMTKDGKLTYNNKSIKCRATKCGTGDEWRQ